MISCLKETINTAFGRYSKIGLCESKQVGLKNTMYAEIFLEFPKINTTALENHISILTDMSSLGYLKNETRDRKIRFI